MRPLIRQNEWKLIVVHTAVRYKASEVDLFELLTTSSNLSTCPVVRLTGRNFP